MNPCLKRILAFVLLFIFVFSSPFVMYAYGALPPNVTTSKTSGPCAGYTLICPGGDPVFLIDMNKSVIHTWSLHGFPAKMLPGGALIGDREGNSLDLYKYIAQEDWQGNIVWEFHNWSD